MMFKSVFSILCAASVASAQLRGLSDPRSVTVKDCTPKDDVEFMSQYHEDRVVYENFFKNKCGGTVVEMGGYDGKTWSNSWFYQYALGWKALLVEAFPENFEKMIQNRPDATNVFGAMCLGESVQFQAGNHGATGGVAQDMSAKHKKLWTDSSTGVIDIPCMQVTKMLLHNNIEHVDLFYLDVEGGELVVLQTIDWGRVQIDMFVIETDHTNHAKEDAIRAFLKAQGYVTPLSMVDECHKMSDACMPSELFVLQDVLENKLK